MKGPKPVWTSATKKFSQSSPRSLRLSAMLLLSVGGRRIRLGRSLVVRRRDGGEDRSVRLVFGEILQLLPVQPEGDRTCPLAGREGQRPPGYDDPALADAEETTVIEDHGARRARSVHQKVDDLRDYLAAHTLHL